MPDADPIKDQIDQKRSQAANLNQEVSRGIRARQIYEDALFKGAVEAIKDDIWKRFRNTPLDDKSGDYARLSLRLELDCLDKVLTGLRRHIETGKLAEREIPMIRKTIEALTQRLRRTTAA